MGKIRINSLEAHAKAKVVILALLTSLLSGCAGNAAASISFENWLFIGVGSTLTLAGVIFFTKRSAMPIISITFGDDEEDNTDEDQHETDQDADNADQDVDKPSKD